MTAFRSLVVLAALLVVGGCGQQSVSSAESCAPPRVLLLVHRVFPGESLSVRVNYTVACQDTNHPQGEAVVPSRSPWHPTLAITPFRPAHASGSRAPPSRRETTHRG